MPPQTLAHKRRIASALKKYHACAKKHGCGKSNPTKKRPVGRPRKAVAAKRPVGRPRKRVTVVTATKRPRGRPRKNMPTAMGRPVKKRGRPLGSKNKPKVGVKRTKIPIRMRPRMGKLIDY